ncbi:MAG: SDR family NAD(P)-dependent oxidoreductase [Burkholderiales bacterium]
MTSNSRLLAGDTALVTGAASGIGRAIAITLAKEGARVLLSDSDAGPGEEITGLLRKEGGDVQFLFANLSSPAGALELMEPVRALAGAPSVFVHSASPRRKESDHILAVDDAIWREMLEVNLHAGFTLSRAVAKDMIANNIKGRMLFITSLHAESPRNLPHYSAAKAGQTMLMKELARALGPHGIRVNAIAPGAIPGGGFDAKGSGLDRLTQCTSLKRLGKPEEIAGMALALLADRFSSYVTGTTVVVDGGIALHNWIEPA